VDYAEYGGCSSGWVYGCVFIFPWKSNAKAIKNAIFQAIELITS